MVRVEQQGRLLHYTDSGSSWHVGRRWGRLSVGWLGIERGRAVASPATLLAPGNSAAGWATVAVPGPLHFGSDMPAAESSGSSWYREQQATYHLPSACLPCHPHPQFTHLATCNTVHCTKTSNENGMGLQPQNKNSNLPLKICSSNQKYVPLSFSSFRFVNLCLLISESEMCV